MTVEFLFLNLVVSFVPVLLVAALLVFAWVYVLRRKLPKHTFKILGAILVFAFVWNLVQTNSPRFTITEESGSAPLLGSDGEISSNAPEKMTDEERLIYNQKLNEENATN